MHGMPIIENDRWASIRVVSIEQTKGEETNPITGITVESQVSTFRLLCDCGGEMVYTNRNFPGRRAVRDCGCGMSYKNSDRRISITLRLPIAQVIALKEVAHQKETPYSQQYTDFIRKGLEIFRTFGEDIYGEDLVGKKPVRMSLLNYTNSIRGQDKTTVSISIDEGLVHEIKDLSALYWRVPTMSFNSAMGWLLAMGITGSAT